MKSQTQTTKSHSSMSEWLYVSQISQSTDLNEGIGILNLHTGPKVKFALKKVK